MAKRSVVGSMFVARQSVDGDAEEIFCAGRLAHFTALEGLCFSGKWRLGRKDPCDGSCQQVGTEIVAAIFRKEMAEAARLPVSVQEGFEAFLARPAPAARVFETWYAKRGGKGTVACLGDIHVYSSWDCDPGAAHRYTGVSFAFRACDGSCWPRCERLSVAY